MAYREVDSGGRKRPAPERAAPGVEALQFTLLASDLLWICVMRAGVIRTVYFQKNFVVKSNKLEGNSLLAEKELALASICGLFSSSMQKSHTPSCPTITYEEALRRELEYRRRLERTHPHLLIALNEAPALSRETCTDSTPDVLKRKLTPESNMPSPQSSFNFTAARSQPANWYPPKKKVIVRQPASQAMQAVQIPRTNSVPSFWCKICKVDCVTEFNFGAHIGGKKHKLKKQLILGNMNTGRPATGSQFPDLEFDVVDEFHVLERMDLVLICEDNLLLSISVQLLSLYLNAGDFSGPIWLLF
uniref:Uncharacterized protein n=1 Tax=Aegilops tauschii TaxID=37682 RepID=N1R113_AEGTA